jgi:hypothetical protein
VNHGQPGTLFLQFIDTLNLYKLDIATGSMSLALSGDAFPELPQPGFIDMLELDNPDKGFLYVLIEDRVPVAGINPILCILRDATRTGLVAGPDVITFEQYESLGYNIGTPMNSHFAWPHWL